MRGLRFYSAILSALGATLIGTVTSPAQASDTSIPAVTVVGNYVSTLRAYRHFHPGLVEFEQYRSLAPKAMLRFAVATDGNRKRILPVVAAKLVQRSVFQGDWEQALEVTEDGWFTLPVSKEAFARDASVEVSRRNAATGKWVLDVQTPGLPAQVYRIGDLRLMCHVYLAIDWALYVRSRGRKDTGIGLAPKSACDTPGTVYFNSGYWPRLQGFRITEGEERQHYTLDPKALPDFLNLAKKDPSAPPWSNDALLELIVPDNSVWRPIAEEKPVEKFN